MENSSSIKRVNHKELADDIWFEIFLHLPLNSIYKFKSVSKVWSSILSSPNFINKWYELNSSSLPWVFACNLKNLDDQWGLQFAYPESHSRFISDHQNRFQNGFPFRFLLDRVRYSYLSVLGTSNGLVLCSPSSFNPEIYYVCNPLTQKWVLLPKPYREHGWVETGFICHECFSESMSYKVIRIPMFKFADRTKNSHVVIFFSDLGKWISYSVSWESYSYENLITHNRVFYSFQKTENRILAVSFDRNNKYRTCGIECSLINIPKLLMNDEKTYLKQCIGESEGLLSFARFKTKEKSLSVWVLDGDWNMLHKDIKLHDWLAQIESQLIFESDGEDWIRDIEVEGFSPVDKNVVILSYEEYVWSYNTKTRMYEQLCRSSFRRNYDQTVVYLSTLNFVLNPRPTILPPVSSE